MKGQILDVNPEGQNSFRACVLWVRDGEMGGLLLCVVNLKTGRITLHDKTECDAPLVNDIFTFNPID